MLKYVQYHSHPVLQRWAPSLYLLSLLQKLAWPRRREVAAQNIWPVPEAIVTVLCTDDDGCGWHPKHVEWTCRIINRLLCVASRWTIINIQGFQRFPLRLCRCQLGRSGKQSARMYCTEVAIHVCHPRECTFLYSSIALLYIRSNLLFFISSYFSDVQSLWQKGALRVYDLEQARHSGRFLKLLRNSPRTINHPSI